MVEIRSFETAIDLYKSDTGALPDTLAQAGAGMPSDPWGWPYEYVKLSGGEEEEEWEEEEEEEEEGEAQPRRDRFLVLINSDYDLYSKGKDGESRVPLTAQASWDDIIRANDGSFVGLASEF
ncbi:type II secretion system protein GspG [Nitrospiraceae bacterium AH_259_D15_M11_P09]|nr:type II secretion system protein GspG [Nitrospiraceae bacterium AH_259_D15_M11_P09]